MWFLYEVLLFFGLLLYLPKALWRRRLPHHGWGMRLGCYPASVTKAMQGRRSLWVHAVSVGEILAARPLLGQLCPADPNDRLVLSTITSSGFAVACEHFRDQGVAVYFPLDLRLCVTRALDAFRPRALLLVESELWPTVIRLTKSRGIPIAVVNGRISVRAFNRYRLVRPWLKGMLQQVDLFLMQSQADADRVLRLGAPADRVRVVGSLKWDASVRARPAPDVVRQTATSLGLEDQELLIVGGSTHRGEERALLDALRDIRQAHPRTRLVIAPRHLERLAEVEALVRQCGLAPRRVSRAEGNSWDVALVDAYGQLPCYYALATIAFVGGTLIPHGGQNPLEATSLGKPVVFGPSVHNFETIVHQLLAHRAARQVGSAQELEGVLSELLTHPADAEAMGRRAQEVTEQFQGATQRTLEALKPLLKGDPEWPRGYA